MNIGFKILTFQMTYEPPPCFPKASATVRAEKSRADLTNYYLT